MPLPKLVRRLCTRKSEAGMSATPPAAAVSTAESLNQHVEDFLSCYIGHKVSPGYAVLLKGRWGSGKTWFLNDFIDLRLFSSAFTEFHRSGKSKPNSSDNFILCSPAKE